MVEQDVLDQIQAANKVVLPYKCSKVIYSSAYRKVWVDDELEFYVNLDKIHGIPLCSNNSIGMWCESYKYPTGGRDKLIRWGDLHQVLDLNNIASDVKCLLISAGCPVTALAKPARVPLADGTVVTTNKPIRTTKTMAESIEKYTTEDWTRALMVISKVDVFRTKYIYGPPGTGKTWAAYNAAPGAVYNVTLTPETPASELRGHYLPNESGGMDWHNGPATLACITPGATLVLNEVSNAGPDVLAFLHPILEGAGTGQFTLPNNETIRIADGVSVIGTDNCSPDELPDALRDRWDATVEIKTYSPGGMMALPYKVRRWAYKTRETVSNGRWVSLRGWGTIGKALEAGVELKEVCVCVFGETDGLGLYTSLKALETQLKLDDEAKGISQVAEGTPSSIPLTSMVSSSDSDSDSDNSSDLNWEE